MFDNCLSEKLPDERAVSPVIGVILMVAVVVVLAAVVTGFVFGIGDDLSNAQPTVDIEFDYDASTSDGQLQVIHGGGDALTAENVGALQLTADNTPVDHRSSSSSSGAILHNSSLTPVDEVTDDSGNVQTSNAVEIESGSQITANNIILTWTDSASMTAGTVVELTWQSGDGSSSEVLGTFEIPTDAEGASG